MTIELPADLMESVRAEVLSGRYPSEDAMVAEVLRGHLSLQAAELPAQGGEVEGTPSDSRSIWDEIAELRQTIPEEEWSKLPGDGAAQLDHYLTGAPKRPER